MGRIGWARRNTSHGSAFWEIHHEVHRKSNSLDACAILVENSVMRSLLLLLIAGLHANAAPGLNCVPQTERRYLLRGASNEWVATMVRATDGGWFVAGQIAPQRDRQTPRVDADAWLARLDTNFNVTWQHTYGTTNLEVATWIAEQPDGSLTLAVATGPDVPSWRSPSNADLHLRLLWLDATGSIVREREYPVRMSDVLGTLRKTADGGFIVAGMYYEDDGERGFGEDDLWIVKLNTEGDVVWEQIYGGFDDEVLSGGIFETEDGGFVVVGGSQSPPSGNKTTLNFGDYDVWVLWLDAQGNKVRERSYGMARTQVPTAAARFANGDLVIASASVRGTSGAPLGNRDVWVLRVADDGNRIWSRTHGGSHDDYIGSIVPLENGDAALGGYFYSPVIRRGTPAGYNLWLLELGEDGSLHWDLPIGTSRSETPAKALARGAQGEFYLAGVSFSDLRGPRIDPVFFKVGPSVVCDRDGDGVPNEVDRCPATRAGEAVDAHGCSVAELVPHDRRWRDNCQYLAALHRVTSQFVTARRMTRAQKAATIAEAVRRHRIRGCPEQVSPGHNFSGDTYGPRANDQ